MIRRLTIGGLLCGLAVLTACATPKPNQPTPPPDAQKVFRLQVYVHDAADAPLPQAHVYLDFVTPRVLHGLGPDAGVAWQSTELASSDFNACGVSDGYVSACFPVGLHQDVTLTIKLAAVPPPPPAPVYSWPPAQPRGALPAFPALSSTQPSNPNGSNGRYGQGVWSITPYPTTLPTSLHVPSQPECAGFHRGDFGSFRVPGLAWHGYGTDLDPTLAMSWDQPRRSLDEQKQILDQYNGVDGYTHFTLSIPQARNAGVLDQRFLDAATTAKTYGHQCIVVVAYGGDGEDWDRDILPWLDRLVALHAVDEIVTCWQCDFHYTPWDLVTLTEQVGAYAHAHGLTVSQHWGNDAAAWWNAADDTRSPNTCRDHVPTICNRFDYHRVMARFVDFQYIQFDTEAPIADDEPGKGGLVIAIQKLLQSLTTEKLVMAEYDTQAEFDDPLHRTEDWGNLKGYLLLCVEGFGKTVDGGYMGGARLPNGRAFRP